MSNFTEKFAPGWPGIPPKWNASKKTGVGVSLNPLSQVWFTISNGILNEIYYPRVDIACIRDMGFLISDGKDFFSEEKRDTVQKQQYLVPGVPAYHFINTCKEKKYLINKEIIADPQRNTLIQRIEFKPRVGKINDYHLFALMAPHLDNGGSQNTAWSGEYKGMPTLFAQKRENAVAMICSCPFKKSSVGFVGISDPWQDISKNKDLQHTYQRAENGNVAVCGEIGIEEAKSSSFIIAIGFGATPNEAAQNARASLLDDYNKMKKHYIKEWQDFQTSIDDFEPKKKLPGNKSGLNYFRISAATLLTHHAQQFPGGYIASLSIPWGYSKGDEDIGGYHLVWPRDLVEISGGLLAAGMKDNALQVLRFLRLVQEPDGHWHQNLWLDGRAYWNGIQLDETAFPILLTHMLINKKVLSKKELKGYVPMVRSAAEFIVKNGPCSEQDRWEENKGYSPFTLAVEISALLAAAEILKNHTEGKAIQYLKDTADIWNDNIEEWTYVKGTEKCQEHEVSGYYIRIAPPNVGETPTLSDDIISIKNIPEHVRKRSAQVVSPDALALVRFGLRSPHDSKILNTIKIIDATLKIETPNGTSWHRYDYDGYGEHEDGSAFNGTGIGRAWPLLTGERAHYEIAAGNLKKAEKLLFDMQKFANQGGMIPEQIWDTEDLPDKDLSMGQASGSAMPLVWAHSEYMKLCRSLHDKSLYDQPKLTFDRYVKRGRKAASNFWRFNRKLKEISKTKEKLRIESIHPFVLHWSLNNWESTEDSESINSTLGIYFVDICITKSQPEDKIRFTFYWSGTKEWEDKDYEVKIRKA